MDKRIFYNEWMNAHNRDVQPRWTVLSWLILVVALPFLFSSSPSIAEIRKIFEVSWSARLLSPTPFMPLSCTSTTWNLLHVVSLFSFFKFAHCSRVTWSLTYFPFPALLYLFTARRLNRVTFLVYSGSSLYNHWASPLVLHISCNIDHLLRYTFNFVC